MRGSMVMEMVKVRGAQIAYEKRGSSGPTLLFVHPPGLGRKTFLRQLPLQSVAQLYLIDLSGHGDSETINCYPLLDLFVEQLHAIIQAEQLKEVVLFGYSAGGCVVQKFVLTYPHLVKGIILSGGYPIVQTKMFRLEHQIGMYMVRHHPHALTSLLAKSHFKDRWLEEQLRQQIEAADRKTWEIFYKEALHFNCVSELSSITCPLMLLYGKNATWINKHASYYHVCPQKEIYYIKGANHQLPTRWAKVVNQLTSEFITRIYDKYIM
jgi:pimeloyl-ACP methyl ester carboxylesterase